MADSISLPKELHDRIAGVTNKRARFVLDSIVKNGVVTTEEINQAGYEHPPRAARDVRELGFPLKTIKVKHTNGRTIAAYTFDEGALQAGKAGRQVLPKKRRDEIIHAAGDKCQICGANHNLQVDHRVPYEVGGEPQNEEDAYQVLCGSCNRKKSWDCEQCANWLNSGDPRICVSCYWAVPDAYEHVAMSPQRRTDLVWTGKEVDDYDRLRNQARILQRSLSEHIKGLLKKLIK